MWKFLGYLGGASAVIYDVLQHDGVPSWLAGAGAAVIGGVKTATVIREKRRTPSKPFDVKDAEDKVGRMR